SQGGAAVGQALIEDNRIDAGINLDGMQWGSMIDTTLHEPFMLISSNWDQDHPNLNKHAYRNLSDSTFYNLIIENTGHSNFMDIPLLINLPYINEVGTIDPYKGYEVTTSLILAFFNKKLKNQETSIKDLAETFEKIEIIN
ncbi:MAG TPA: hypothetical protein VFI78_00180, partial [Salinimicrobium sp.]|nr:hypothetical protein [Salinimicrobium sp.]